MKIEIYDFLVKFEIFLRYYLKFKEKFVKEKGLGNNSGDGESEGGIVIFYRNFWFLFIGDFYIEFIFYVS